MPSPRLSHALVALGLTLLGAASAPGEEIARLAEGSPVAKRLTAKSFADRENGGQWGFVEGYVLDWSYQAPDLRVRLVTSEGFIETSVTVSEAAAIPPRLHGAAVRLTGTVGGTPESGRRLLVPSLRQLEVREDGTAGIFEAPLVSIPDVMKRKLEGGRRWRVRGILAAQIDPRSLILTGPDGAMQCHLVDPGGASPAAAPRFQPGDVLEVVGSILEGNAPQALTFCQTRVVGRQAPPTPERIDLDTLRNLRNDDRWATVECSVGAWKLAGSVLTYAVADARANLGISVRNSPPDRFPRDLHNALVRFTGISTSLARNTQGSPMIVPDPSFVEIIEPGREDPFDVTAHSAFEIANGLAPVGRRVKTRGVLTERNGGVLYLRGVDGALSARLQVPWARPENTDGIQFVDCGPLPGFTVGDELEVMGTLIRNPQDEDFAPFDLVSANVRVAGAQRKIDPVGAALATVADGAHTSEVVELRGRLVTIHHIPAGQQWRSVFLLEAGNKRLPVVFQGLQSTGFETLKIDDEVIARGVVTRATRSNPRQLWLAATSDIRSLGLSPSVLDRRLWLGGGAGAAALTLLGAWVALLRRSARSQAATAAQLERSVHERTADLQEAQIELQAALERERELSGLKSRFVSMVSHEFRTPLGVIMSSVELLQHYAERLPDEERRGQLESIRGSTKHMGDLMEQVLVLSRSDAGKIGFRPQPLDLLSLVEKIVDETRSLTGGRCPIVLQTEGELSAAHGDESLLRHILGNLLANAVKYSPAGSEVACRIRRDGEWAEFVVADRGIGIPEEDLARLFEAFQRGSNVGDTPGTGLGLVIVKRCVELHGGRIDLQAAAPSLRPEAPSGTIFTVRLPLFGNPAASA